MHCLKTAFLPTLHQNGYFLMKEKFLGNTRTKLPEIGLGTWAYKAGVEPLRLGVSLGAYHIDTAEMYHTENIVGKAIQDIRANVFVSTKVSPEHLHYDDVITAAKGSLSRLNIKTIDLYQVHWPNSRIPIKETMKAMEYLVEKNMIRYIGVSNFSVDELKDAQAALSKNQIVSDQIEYNLQNRGAEEELIPYCKSEKITVIAYSPLTRGQVTHRKDSVLDELSVKYGKTRGQLSLNFLTREDNVVAIPKSDTEDHIRENCAASGWRLSADDIQLMSTHFVS